jgi:hypothetical protein
VRAIGRHAAERCELGKCKRCRCRCRGQAHGRKRTDLESLPVWDWHNPKNRAEPEQTVMFPIGPQITTQNTGPRPDKEERHGNEA